MKVVLKRSILILFLTGNIIGLSYATAQEPQGSAGQAGPLTAALKRRKGEGYGRAGFER